MTAAERRISDRLPSLLRVAVLCSDSACADRLSRTLLAAEAAAEPLAAPNRSTTDGEVERIAAALTESGCEAVIVCAEDAVEIVLSASRNVPERPAVLVLTSDAFPAARCARFLTEGAQDVLEPNLDAAALRTRLGNAVLRQRSVTRWERLAEMDPLTGLLNRRGLTIRLNSGAPMTAMLIDVDHFKRINDRYGHAIGDRVLRGVAKAVMGVCRPTDFVARIGGDELLVVVGGLDEAKGREVANRLRDAVARTSVQGPEGFVNVTGSIGVASVPAGVDDVSTLLAHCRRALAKSKRGGRDRVTVDLSPRDLEALGVAVLGGRSELADGDDGGG